MYRSLFPTSTLLIDMYGGCPDKPSQNNVVIEYDPRDQSFRGFSGYDMARGVANDYEFMSKNCL